MLCARMRVYDHTKKRIGTKCSSLHHFSQKLIMIVIRQDLFSLNLLFMLSFLEYPAILSDQ